MIIGKILNVFVKNSPVAEMIAIAFSRSFLNFHNKKSVRSKQSRIKIAAPVLPATNTMKVARPRRFPRIIAVNVMHLAHFASKNMKPMHNKQQVIKEYMIESMAVTILEIALTIVGSFDAEEEPPDEP